MADADRAILSIAGPGIAKEFSLSHVQLGYVLSAFRWAYVVGQVPGGYAVGLYFVAAHCLAAALIYLLFMGKVERVKMA